MIVKQLVLIVLTGLLFFSCSHNRNKDVNAKSGESSHRFGNAPHQQKIEKSNEVPLKDTTVYTNGAPKITPLPFGPKTSLNKLYTANRFYTDKIYRNSGELLNYGWTAKALKRIKFYKLPPIKKLNYIYTFGIDTDKCQDGKPFGDFLKLNKYRYRLPDINNYQCYYMCDYDYGNRQYTLQVKQNCDASLLSSFYGYLVFYNSQIEQANVLAIYYDTFRDGSNHYRYFYIDKDYNITLADFSQEADDSDASNLHKLYNNGKHLITILKNGKIEIIKLE